MKENSAVKSTRSQYPTIQAGMSLPASVVDPGKVQMGAYSPAFPGPRAK